MASLKNLSLNLVRRVVARLRREPVAVWGSLLAIVLGVLPVVGVPAATVTWVGVAASLLGVPVVRSKVSPTGASFLRQLVAWVRRAVKGS